MAALWKVPRDVFAWNVLYALPDQHTACFIRLGCSSVPDNAFCHGAKCNQQQPFLV